MKERTIMDKKLISWGNGILETVQLVMDRTINGTLSSKDKQNTIMMIGEYAEEIHTAIDDPKLYESICNLQEILFSGEVNQMEEGKKLVKNGLMEYEKLQYISEALQLDTQVIMQLEEEIKIKKVAFREAFQKAVDIDIELSGKPSELTLNAMAAYQMRIDKGNHIIPVPVEEIVKESEKEKVKVERIALKLPKKMDKEERKALEKEIFKLGARYEKWSIPAERSYDGKPHAGRNWYILKREDTNMEVFQPYLKYATSHKSKNAEKPSVKEQIEQKKKDLDVTQHMGEEQLQKTGREISNGKER